MKIRVRKQSPTLTLAQIKWRCSFTRIEPN